MGPCAVESLDQVRQVAQAMREHGIKLMRVVRSNREHHLMIFKVWE